MTQQKSWKKDELGKKKEEEDYTCGFEGGRLQLRTWLREERGSQYLVACMTLILQLELKRHKWHQSLKTQFLSPLTDELAGDSSKQAATAIVSLKSTLQAENSCSQSSDADCCSCRSRGDGGVQRRAHFFAPDAQVA